MALIMKLLNEKDKEVKDKELSEEVVDKYKCKNPRCITTIEQELPNVFVLSDSVKGIYRCKYCETINNLKT